MKKQGIRIIFSNFCVFVLGWLLLSAEVDGFVSPFFVAFLFALFYLEENPFSYIFGAVFAGIISNFSFKGILVLVNLLLVIVLIKWITHLKKQRVRMIAVFPLIVMASVSKVLFALGDAETFVLSTINLLLEVVFAYAYIIFFRAIKRRGTNTKLAMDELIGLALLIAPVTLALSKLTIQGINLTTVLVPMVILLILNLMGGVEAIVFAIIAGLGVSFNTLNLSMLGVWVFYAIGGNSVKNLGRWASAIVLVVIDLIMAYYFEVFHDYTWINTVVLASVGLVYSVLPKRVFRMLKLNLYDKTEEICLNEIVVQEERLLKERLKRVSGLFLEMHKIYSNMIIGSLDRTQVENVIKNDVVKKNCEHCPKYKFCFDARGMAPRSILELVKKGLSKGTVTLVDLPVRLTSVCGKTNHILYQINLRLEEYFKYEKDLKQEDEGKTIMSNHLMGVSELLDEFGTSFEFGERADTKEENALIDSFLYNDIIVKECAIFYEDGLFKRTVLVVKNDAYKKLDIINTAKFFFKRLVSIADVRYTKYSGWQILTIVPAPKFVTSFGVARTSKHEKSGDTFSEIEIDEIHKMYALSDGKGCGRDANKISELTLNLIENFYKAGFSTEHIMDNVNKVMSYKSGENFSAVDVCVIDLDTARADFVKKGGTPSVIKKLNHAHIVEGQDLPVGVLENAKSRVVNYYLNSGDVIVLASDGVFDAFNTSENFAGFINNTPAINMQEFSKNILNEAIRLNRGKVYDDMTVMAIKIILNR